MAYLEPDDWVDKLIKFLMKVYIIWIFWDNFPPKGKKHE